MGRNRIGSRQTGWAISLGIAALAALVMVAGTRAQDDGKAAKRSPEKNGAAVGGDSQFEVPDGTPDELRQFLGELMNKELGGGGAREGGIELRKKLLRTIAAVQDKILAGKPDDKVASQAINDKFQALWMLSRFDDANASAALEKAAARYAGDKRPEIASDAKAAIIGGRFFKTKPGDVREIKAQIDQLSKQLPDVSGNQLTLRVAAEIAGALDERDQSELAADAYKKFAEALEMNPKNEQIAAEFRALAEKLAVIGKPIALSGVLANGKKFDWTPYKGKVVLVDFWATWCGPCMAELPNVRKTYETFHKKGFDVIGVDLDEDRAALDQFLVESKIPWSTIVGPTKEESGWNHPLVTQYKVDGIPAMFLVNRAGKVVSINARGEKLAKRVAELLEEKAPKTAVSSTD